MSREEEEERRRPRLMVSVGVSMLLLVSLAASIMSASIGASPSSQAPAAVDPWIARQAQRLAAACREELDAFSRQSGRHREG